MDIMRSQNGHNMVLCWHLKRRKNGVISIKENRKWLN
jgi:hypothetical protein